MLSPEERAILAGERGEAARRALEYQVEGRRVLGRAALRAGHQRPHDGRHRGDGRRRPRSGSRTTPALGGALRRGHHHQRALLRLRALRQARAGRRRGGEGARADRLPAPHGRGHHRHLHQLPDRLPAAPRRARGLGRHRHGDLRQLGVRRALQLRVRAGGARRGASPGARPNTAFTWMRTAGAASPSSCRRSSTTSPTGAWWASWWARRTRATSRCRCSTATGARRRADELKHLGAALASYGSMGMFHFVGVTPGGAVARGGARRAQAGRAHRDHRRRHRARLRRLRPGRTATRGWWCSPGRSSRCSK